MSDKNGLRSVFHPYRHSRRGAIVSPEFYGLFNKYLKLHASSAKCRINLFIEAAKKKVETNERDKIRHEKLSYWKGKKSPLQSAPRVSGVGDWYKVEQTIEPTLRSKWTVKSSWLGYQCFIKIKYALEFFKFIHEPTFPCCMIS